MNFFRGYVLRELGAVVPALQVRSELVAVNAQ